MNQVFEETELAGNRLKNRIIRSATFEGMGDESGRPTDKLSRLYVRLAEGGVGAIITGGMIVQQNGRPLPRSLMIDSDGFLDAFREMISPVKALGTPIIAQLEHAGGLADRATTGTEAVGPSKKKYPSWSTEARELTGSEIQEIIEAFVKAIERAKQVGFDGVQLHAAHGYLLSAFLSPRVNKRKDKWGGSTENRFRIIREIVQGARQMVGDYPILAKFSAYDGDKGGVSAEEGIRIAELMETAGIDAVETSCGSGDDGFNSIRVPKVPVEALLRFMPAFRNSSALVRTFYKALLLLFTKKWSPLHNFNIQTAHEIKKRVKIPVIAVGGIRDINQIRSVVTEGKADYVSMSRPFIIEPDIVKKFFAETQEQSKCIDCGYCLFGLYDASLRCYQGKL
jgi:2,4-dienoyl-CoA reductase-like NADH-dependent reductase (Old Yellow Enzyme family)